MSYLSTSETPADHTGQVMVTVDLKDKQIFIIIIIVSTSTVKGPPLSPWQLSWPGASPQIMSSKMLISDHGEDCA